MLLIHTRNSKGRRTDTWDTPHVIWRRCCSKRKEPTRDKGCDHSASLLDEVFDLDIASASDEHFLFEDENFSVKSRDEVDSNNTLNQYSCRWVVTIEKILLENIIWERLLFILTIWTV